MLVARFSLHPALYSQHSRPALFSQRRLWPQLFPFCRLFPLIYFLFKFVIFFVFFFRCVTLWCFFIRIPCLLRTFGEISVERCILLYAFGEIPKTEPKFRFKEEKPDSTCCICYELMCEPCTLPCKHNFCLACIEQVFDNQECCPVCRFKVPITFDLLINKSLQKTFFNQDKEKF